MNIYSIQEHMEAVEELGCTLSPPERINLELGLLKLTEKANTDDLLFWGKINTNTSPYYIAMGIDFEGNY